MTKKLMYLLAMLMLIAVMAGCAGFPGVGIFSEPGYNTVLSGVNANSTKTAELSGSTFNIFGYHIGLQTFPTLAETARHGNITKIASVQFYKKPLFFGLFTRYTTIVTGE